MARLPFAAALLALSALVRAAPSPIAPDPSGAKNVGNGQGLQFITGACLSTADCSQATVQSCCAAIVGDASTGICSGIAVGNANGKAGCGFGDGNNSTETTTTTSSAVPTASSTTVAGSSASCAVDVSLAGSANVGTGGGTQFITGQCLSKADCASGCCVAQASGVAQCKAQLVTEQAGGSCDFVCTT